MEKKTRPKMPISDRAKQFAPFSALKGFEQALAAKETVSVSEAELSPDTADIINYELQHLHCAEEVTLIYYDNGTYRKITGLVSAIDTKDRFLKIAATIIPFDHIYSVTRQ